MENKISQKYNIVFNSVPDQVLRYANQLSIQAWNDTINMLRTQANINAEYVQTLHKWLIGVGTDTFTLPSTYTSFVEYAFDSYEHLNVISPRVDKLEERTSNIIHEITNNRVGLLKVGEYNEETGEIEVIFDQSKVESLSYDEETGILNVNY